jgi:hypothetical protein
LGSSGASAVVAAASSTLSENSGAIFGRMRSLKMLLTGEERTEDGTLNRRTWRSRRTNATSDEGDERIELTQMNEEERERDRTALTSIAVDNGNVEANDEVGTVAASSSDTQPTTSGAATSTTGWLGSVTGFLSDYTPGFIKSRMRRLRMAHEAAAQRAATEQSVLRDQVLNRQSAAQGPGLRTMMSSNRASQSIPFNNSNGTEEGYLRSSTLDSDLSSTGDQHLSLTASNGVQDSSTTSNLSLLSSPFTPLESTAPLQRGGEQEDDEWVDDDEADRQGEGSLREELATTVDDGDDHHRTSSLSQTSSWSWRGGLKTLRMRDHTSYDQ